MTKLKLYDAKVYLNNFTVYCRKKTKQISINNYCTIPVNIHNVVLAALFMWENISFMSAKMVFVGFPQTHTSLKAVSPSFVAVKQVNRVMSLLARNKLRTKKKKWSSKVFLLLLLFKGQNDSIFCIASQ